jgi:hypothetical protein
MTLELETLHVVENVGRVALIESHTKGSDRGPAQRIRYQFFNLLDSVCLKLDEHAKIISYEEYLPFGSTSYQAVDGNVEVRKGYHYDDKEQDKESGF